MLHMPQILKSPIGGLRVAKLRLWLKWPKHLTPLATSGSTVLLLGPAALHARSSSAEFRAVIQWVQPN